jgi:4-hydroxyphenylacetate 3-monooxygenase
MPARTGQEYLRGLLERRREVWMWGGRIEDVTTHPAFRNGARSVAALYDMQHDPALPACT